MAEQLSDPAELEQIRKDMGLPEGFAGQLMTAEMQVADKPFQLVEEAPLCDHMHFTEQVTAGAETTKNEDGTERVVGWKARIRLRCADCGIVFDLAKEGTAPRDGGPGLVVRLTPVTDW
jgi:hypothetical protein